MWSSRSMLALMLGLVLSPVYRGVAASGRLNDEFVWGFLDDSSQRVCHSQSVIVPPTWEAFFALFRPVTRLVTFTPPGIALLCFQPGQSVRYIRVWTDAPWYRFRAELVLGGVGTKAPIPTVIQLSRHWMLFANVVIYCSTS
ncbi:uncharacterized protein LOC131212360 [Anopheles bellator]|uniref:uncharacterized protein LOC131212360 n=1 Tax=Anopheles bellator TaxID=139047 RepID=UPI0026494F0A|nr:uncharacterized protein LOC131212360 [Anopheles bellator]